MGSRFHTDSRSYYIYLLLDRVEQVFFVGKCRSKDPRARFRAHLRGELALTRDDFGPEGDSHDSVEFHILEDLVCTGADAYKHIVAWCCFFEEQGFILLNGHGTFWHCDSLHPKTNAIYQEVCLPYTLDQVLNRRFDVPRHTEPSNFAPQMTQLNLRAEQSVADSFRQFCTTHNWTQNEALNQLLLLTKHTGYQCALDAAQQRAERQECTIQALQTELADLRKQLSDIKQAHQTACAARTNMEKGFFDLLLKYGHPPAEENHQTFRSYASELRCAQSASSFTRYHYPQESGSAVIRLDSVYYGKGRSAPLLIQGETDNGVFLKLRWFPREGYLGITPRSKRFPNIGSYLIVGYRKLDSGAAELMAALPLDVIAPPSNPATHQDTSPPLHPVCVEPLKHESSEDLRKRPPLDAVISQAKQKTLKNCLKD